MTDAPLVEHHVLEYPGGYTRSIGPALSPLLHRPARRRDRRRPPADGRVMVPPTEYDPMTAAALDEYVEVGPAGHGAPPGPGSTSRGPASTTSTSRSRSRSCGPTAPTPPMVHVVDAARGLDARSACGCSRAGAAERVGYVTDLDAWVPLADGGRARPGAGQRATARPTTRSPASRRRSGSSTRSTPGTACEQVPAAAWPSARSSGPGPRTPTRSTCRRAARTRPRARRRPIEVEVADTGTRHHVLRRQHPGLSDSAPEMPYVSAQILLDGADTPCFGLIQGVAVGGGPHGDAGAGGLGRGAARPTRSNIKWFEPTGEPDADYDSYRGVRVMRDVAVVWLRAGRPRSTDRERNEVEFVIPVVREAIERVGHAAPGHRLHDLGIVRLPRAAGRSRSCMGARRRRRVAADQGEPRRDGRGLGAVRGLGRDPDRRRRQRLIYGFGKASLGDLHRASGPCRPTRTRWRRCGRRMVDMAALQADALHGRRRVARTRDLAEVAARSRRSAQGNPHAVDRRGRRASTTCSAGR